LVLYVGGQFGVDKNGKLYANGVKISGEIIANRGYIANWEITSNKIEYSYDSDNNNDRGYVYLKGVSGNSNGNDKWFAAEYED
jgi:hypothetical protein